MEVKVLFFGVLADVAATDMKLYHGAGSVRELRLMILDDFPELAHYTYRISLNREIIIDDHKLTDGDEVAFLPPFAGG